MLLACAYVFIWLILSSTGEPPSCNCSTTNSTSITITCSLTYSDASYHPIPAKMTWTANGAPYKVDTPARTRVGVWTTATSVIIVDAYDAANYQCTVTFTKPVNPQFAYVATNAPAFSASCTPPCKYKYINLNQSNITFQDIFIIRT